MTEEWEAGKIRVVFIQFGSRRLRRRMLRAKLSSQQQKNLDKNMTTMMHFIA